MSEHTEFWSLAAFGREFGFVSADYYTGWHRGQDVPGRRSGREWVGKTVPLLRPGRLVSATQQRKLGGVYVFDVGGGEMDAYCHVHPHGDGFRLSTEADAPEWRGSSFRGAHLHLVRGLSIDAAWNTDRAVLDPRPIIAERLAGFAGGPSTPFDPVPEEDDMTTPEQIAEIARNNWHGIEFKNGRTPGQELVSLGQTAVRIELALAKLGNTGRFYKHGGPTTTLWIYVLENGDFVRIRDLATARLYLERNGSPAVVLSPDAIRQMVADMVAAGGQDLSAVNGTTSTRPTTPGEDDEDES